METILIVDDDKDVQFTISNILKHAGYETIIAGGGNRALREIRKRSPDLALLDIRLPGMDGIKILEEMKRIDKDLTIVMVTAYGDIKNVVNAMKLGAYDYITKPFDNEELLLVVKKALQTRYLNKEVEILRRKLGERMATGIIGESPQIKQVFKQVEIIAPTNMTVIIQGESGTGKELIAHMIHQKSQRRDKPFIPIDCAAMPETLVESELFGYEKGAFTGAEERKEGKFEQASGGTLLLDEITNLSDAVQMKLLRVIQERRLQHLGGKRDISIDVRIIVATNINLSDAARNGKFREDLFHRLNEFQIDLPPLRERKEDFPILAKYFLDEGNNEFNKKIKGFSAEAINSLFNYHWPGNVREMRNIVRKAVLLTDSDCIELSHFSTNTHKPQNETGTTFNTLRNEIDLAEIFDRGISFEEINQEFVKNLIKKALQHTGGNKKKTAEILKINRRMLYRKMKSLSL
jgi:two-component system response regulator AtoC